MADLEFTGSGAQTSSCQDRIGEAYGIQQSNPPEPAQYGGAIVYHVVLTVDDLGCATANVTFSDICGMIHPWLLEGFGERLSRRNRRDRRSRRRRMMLGSLCRRRITTIFAYLIQTYQRIPITTMIFARWSLIHRNGNSKMINRASGQALRLTIHPTRYHQHMGEASNASPPKNRSAMNRPMRRWKRSPGIGIPSSGRISWMRRNKLQRIMFRG